MGIVRLLWSSCTPQDGINVSATNIRQTDSRVKGKFRAHFLMELMLCPQEHLGTEWHLLPVTE